MTLSLDTAFAITAYTFMLCWTGCYAESRTWNFPELGPVKQGENYFALLPPNLSYKTALAAQFRPLCLLPQTLMPEKLSTAHFCLDTYPFVSYLFSFVLYSLLCSRWFLLLSYLGNKQHSPIIWCKNVGDSRERK